jgi:hypothetical protein
MPNADTIYGVRTEAEARRGDYQSPEKVCGKKIPVDKGMDVLYNERGLRVE